MAEFGNDIDGAWQLPPPLIADSGFALATMASRHPPMVSRLAQTLPYLDATQRDSLTQLARDLARSSPITPPLTPWPTSEEAAAWRRSVEGHTWATCPWYVGEAYLYRLILELTGYWTHHQDPFEVMKSEELTAASTWELVMNALSLPPLAALLQTNGEQVELSGPTQEDIFCKLAELSLWGNRADGCYAAVIQSSGVLGQSKDMLTDHRRQVWAYLRQSPSAKTAQEPGGIRLAFVVDNGGKELLMDLILVFFVLRARICDKIILHVKRDPTFVSDVTPADVSITLQNMVKQAQRQGQGGAALQMLAEMLSRYFEQGVVEVRPDGFWNSQHHFAFLEKHAPDLSRSLSRSRLAIVKGDANYRRMLGDSVQWDIETTMATAGAKGLHGEGPGFPCPFVCLRTLKSDPIVGLSKQHATELQNQDSEWKVNGKRGVIQASHLPVMQL